MYKSAFLLVAAMASSACGNEPQRRDSAVDIAVSQLADNFVKSDKAGALSIALVRNGKAHFYNFGSLSQTRRQPPSQLNIYEIGSITKVFTSLLLAHAVTEGKIGLHDDIRRYLPGSYPNLSFHGTPVRMIDLADTTSGLPDNLPDFRKIMASAGRDQGPAILAQTLRNYTVQNMLADLHSVSLAGKPGAVPRHSNLAANLLGFILGRVYATSYSEALSRYIEVPLGLASGTHLSNPSLLVTGYGPDHKPMPATDQAAVLAAGGLRYSSADMATFLQAEMAASDPALRLSQQPAWGEPNVAAVGFNWNITRNVESALQLNTSGGTFGCASYIEMYPALGYGVVFLANRSGETESLLHDLADELFQRVQGTPSAAALKTALLRDGYAHVSATVAAVRREHPNLHLTESYVNEWAGSLLDAHPQAAIGLFQYNVEHWPKSSNAWDSLGDGFARVGDRQRAISAYRTALQLDPANGEASDSLHNLLKK